jgi:hypothetical protein
VVLARWWCPGLVAGGAGPCGVGRGRRSLHRLGHGRPGICGGEDGGRSRGGRWKQFELNWRRLGVVSGSAGPCGGEGRPLSAAAGPWAAWGMWGEEGRSRGGRGEQSDLNWRCPGLVAREGAVGLGVGEGRCLIWAFRPDCPREIRGRKTRGGCEGGRRAGQFVTGSNRPGLSGAGVRGRGGRVRGWRGVPSGRGCRSAGRRSGPRWGGRRHGPGRDRRRRR